jgi:hypothetical protein
LEFQLTAILYGTAARREGGGLRGAEFVRYSNDGELCWFIDGKTIYSGGRRNRGSFQVGIAKIFFE